MFNWFEYGYNIRGVITLRYVYRRRLVAVDHGIFFKELNILIKPSFILSSWYSDFNKAGLA